MFRTNNFKNPKIWVKRAIFVVAFGGLFYLKVLYSLELNHFQITIFVLVLIILVLIGQIDDIEINTTHLTVKQNSLIPFFRSSRKYQLSEITNIRKNSNYIEGDGSWIILLFRKRKAVELIFSNGKSEILDAKLHPDGIKGIESEINKAMSKL